MEGQLPLLDPDRSPPAATGGRRGGGDGPWRLDAHTRRVGKQGIAAARRALAEAAERAGDRSAA